MTNTPPRPALTEPVEDVRENYDAADVPLGSYLGLMGIYTLAFGTLFVVATRGGRKIRQPGPADLAFLTVAAYKLSRIVTMSFVASPLRAPFAKRGRGLKGGEVQDQSRGEGLQKAVGNLLTCPFCFNVWSQTFFLFGYSLLPRLTPHLARILTMAAAGDVLHHGYRTLREKSE